MHEVTLNLIIEYSTPSSNCPEVLQFAWFYKFGLFFKNCVVQRTHTISGLRCLGMFLSVCILYIFTQIYNSTIAGAKSSIGVVRCDSTEDRGTCYGMSETNLQDMTCASRSQEVMCQPCSKSMLDGLTITLSECSADEIPHAHGVVEVLSDNRLGQFDHKNLHMTSEGAVDCSILWSDSMIILLYNNFVLSGTVSCCWSNTQTFFGQIHNYS